MYYSVLWRSGNEWDGQSVFYTKSKALFDFVRSITFNNYRNGGPMFKGFSPLLQADFLLAVKEEDCYPDLDEVTLFDAIEFLEAYTIVFPITVLGHTELTTLNWK